MILNSKQLEELESIHDSVAEFEEDAASPDSDSFDEGAESALAWRRGMIEKAAANVKKIHKKPIDPQASYALGTLLFDRNAKRFARVGNSSHGVLNITYLTGGEGNIKHSQDGLSFDEAAPTPAEKPKLKVAAPEKPTATPKTKIKSKPAVKKEEEPKDIKSVKSLMANETPAKKKVAAVKSAEKPTLKTVTKTKTQQKVSKPLVKKAAKAKPEKKKTFSKPQKPVAKPAKKVTKHKATTHTPYGNMSDPVADPNGYIKQHFRLMSNKELANVTGLSEHTIRRKLGEWGLKRFK